MKEQLVHQWRDWLLKYAGDDVYKLINKKSLSTQTVTAKNFMDAETKSQLIIKNEKDGKNVALPNSNTKDSTEESVKKA